jgi:hypothetical protein
LGYLDFVDLLLEEEVGLREGRRFRNALKLSGLPHHKPSTSLTSRSNPAWTHARSKISPPWSSSGTSPTLLSSDLPASGNHARHRLGRRRLPSRLSIYFTTLDDLVRRLRAAEATGRFSRQLQTYLRPAVLVVDEVGYLPLDRAEANMVFQLVSRRYERGTMIITSNKSFTEWGQVLGDDVLATAILDRLLHHCDVININGPSYRLKDRLTLVAGGEPMP